MRRTWAAVLWAGTMPLLAQQTIFAPRVDIGNLPNAACSVILDANRDGRPDLAVAAGNLVYLLLQNPGPPGTFGVPRLVANAGAGNVITGMVTADFNGDQKADFAFITNATQFGGSPGTIQVFLGDGQGGFSASPSAPASSDALASIAVGDFNGDRKPDIVVFENGGIGLLYFGDGSGGFPTFNILFGGNGSGLAVGDVNHDNLPDIVHGTGVFPGNSNGTVGTPAGSNHFNANIGLAGGILNPTFNVLADLNNDTNTDVLEFAPNLVAEWLGIGDGTFQTAVTQSVVATSGLGVADFNFDGKPDAVLLSGGGNASLLNIYLGTGAGQFQTTPLSLPACNNTVNLAAPNALTIGDLNGDGVPDVIASCPAGNTVSVFLSLTPSVFLQTSANPSLPGQTVQASALVGSPSMGFVYTSGFSVQFFDGSTPLGGPVQVSNGLATRPLSSLAQGIHYLTASLLNGQGVKVATSGIVTQVVAPSSCASNLTGQIQIAPGGFRRNPTTGQWVQSVTLTNVSGAPISGPLSLALGNLTPGVTALNTDGLTVCSSPAAVPFVDTGLCPGGTLAPGKSLSVNLTFSNPSNTAIAYTASALSGFAPR